MTKAEIADLISERAGFSRREASEVLEAVLELIKGSLQDGKMFWRPQTRRDSGLVEPLIERFTILGHEQYLLDCNAWNPVAEV